jgi:hypothetical protein
LNLKVLKEKARIDAENKRRDDEVKMMLMDDRERNEFLRMRAEEEAQQERIRQEAEEKRRHEMDLKMNEAKIKAEMRAREKAQLDLKLAFNASLHFEELELSNSHSLTRAFTYSYFELLEKYGIVLPDNLKDTLLPVNEQEDEEESGPGGEEDD